MHATPDLTPAAMERWLRLSDESKELILARIWCGWCQAKSGMREARGELHPAGDIILTGICPQCGGKIVRLIETGETMGRAKEFP
jgi:hypothetical protein